MKILFIIISKNLKNIHIKCAFWWGVMKNINEKTDSYALEILRELYKNSKITYQKLSKKLGISPVACYNRVNILKERGIIQKYTIKIDAQNLGYPIKTLIEVKAECGLSSEVAKKLYKHSNILKVYEITGETDAIIEACFRDINELNIFLKKIRKACPEITDTITHIVLDEHENPDGWWH